MNQLFRIRKRVMWLRIRRIHHRPTVLMHQKQLRVTANLELKLKEMVWLFPRNKGLIMRMWDEDPMRRWLGRWDPRVG